MDRPHDSFDPSGYLRAASFDASDQHERVSGPMTPEDRADRERRRREMDRERREKVSVLGKSKRKFPIDIFLLATLRDLSKRGTQNGVPVLI